jgi:glutathione S-transferase
MLRYWTVWLSPNAERVELALAYKGLEAERIQVPYEERTEVEAVSGQSRVPVLDHDGRVIADSEAILRYLEQEFPDPPLWPSEPRAHAEAEVFVEWFNQIWKRPFNEIYWQLTAEDGPDEEAVQAWGQRMIAYLDVFESLLTDRDHLLGDSFGIADVLAYPFLKFPAIWVEGDPYLHHEILRDWQPLAGKPRLEAWIHRVNDRRAVTAV